MEQNLHRCYSQSSSSSSEEEDYINMEVDHHASFNSIFSQSTNKEFEFQSFSSSSDRDNNNNNATTSPADELFYMGKLLPLHLPPRLEMVHKILQNSASFQDEQFSTPLFTPASNTPFESCNVSPSQSCHVSGELNPNEYFIEHLPGKKTTWTKKVKMIKQSSGIGSKLKWFNLKSLFTKSAGCSDEYSAAADQRYVPKAKQCVDSHWKTAAAPFGQIKYNKDVNLVEDCRGGGHRRSFSGAFKRLSKPKTVTNSASNSNRNAYKRSINSNSEFDNPIQAAIAHCKRSQNSRQIVVDEVAFCSISASSRVLYG